MHIYLLRHAEAEPHRSDDFSRRLTEKGHKQARRVGCFMKAQFMRPDIILTSPVVRALETAEIVSRIIGKTDIVQVAWAACGMDPGKAIAELGSYNRFKSILLVGHEPDFSCLAATFLGIARSTSVNISKGSLTEIESTRLAPGEGVLKLLLPVNCL
jgi:phosphohistidine phosphatase